MPSLMDMIRGGFGGMAQAPQVPADGAMQPTIGPGAAPPAPARVPFKQGLPPGGLLGLLQGTPPQGLMGMLMGRPASAPVAGAMPQAGMMAGVGMPGSPMAGPVAPPAAPVQLPQNINPMDQY